jgi:hypothetical protein
MRKTFTFLSAFAVCTLPAAADWYERPYDPANPPIVVVQPIPLTIQPQQGLAWYAAKDRVRETQQRLEHQRLMNEYLRNQVELQRRQLQNQPAWP